ncbi:transcriptional regulator [Rodentibacter ratti]|uniref:helix-turn-helix domain-containing protein n=1 Tax=Rodentibacter ratti TaxID=1906745 RepID=UPI000985CD20|nr:helix-turn-helix transcriptional regulator [Rodentibacter ratti]OOF86843.1 transcriptional regulator [Rodentibacter ratti]
MNISKRLKQVLEAKKLNIKTFSERSCIPYRSVQNYLREEREPNVEALIKLKETMNININWLLIGEGEMFSSEIEKESLSISEIELIKNYRESNEKSQYAIQSLATILREANR